MEIVFLDSRGQRENAGVPAGSSRQLDQLFDDAGNGITPMASGRD